MVWYVFMSGMKYLMVESFSMLFAGVHLTVHADTQWPVLFTQKILSLVPRRSHTWPGNEAKKLYA